MGSFSWNRADNLGKVKNIYYGCAYKMLIPEKFGGGFIRDHYRDYGYIGEPNEKQSKDFLGKYDIYELLAFWNCDKIVDGKTVKEQLLYDGEFPKMKECDEYTNHNRLLGIKIACYDEDMSNLEYPLKLVSVAYKGTYEDCDEISFSDPEQGFYAVYR